MADVDPPATHQDLAPDIPAEMRQAGFEGVEEIGHGGFGGRLSLRPGARITNERIRLCIELPQAVAAGLRSPRTIPGDSGIATLTAELDEDSAVRLLSGSDSADDREQACRRTAELAVGIDGGRRPLAGLQAQLLLVETLTAAGRTTDARNELAPVAAKCAELGLSRLLVDGGLA